MNAVKQLIFFHFLKQTKINTMYEFTKYGCLVKHNGIPMYAGDQLISKFNIVWWWPWNWVVILLSLPYAIMYTMRDYKNASKK